MFEGKDIFADRMNKDDYENSDEDDAHTDTDKVQNHGHQVLHRGHSGNEMEKGKKN